MAAGITERHRVTQTIPISRNLPALDRKEGHRDIVRVATQVGTRTTRSIVEETPAPVTVGARPKIAAKIPAATAA
jgi:hypothetical protein